MATKGSKWVMLAAVAVPCLIVGGMFIFKQNLPTFYVPSGGMIDTLHIGDTVMAAKLEPRDGDIWVFDPPARALFPGQRSTVFIKRLIGVPGDVIEWKQKHLFRNGRPVEEPYVAYTSPGSPDGPVIAKDQWREVPQADFKLVRDGDRYIPVQYTAGTVNRMPISDEASADDAAITTSAEEFTPADATEARKWKSLPPAAVPAGMYLFIGDNRSASYDSRGWGLVPRSSLIGKCVSIVSPPSRSRKL